ncbi:oxaloacetate decarboxylase [Candidatus Amesbacteria bacterium]|nr:oxaloacetate decarboxylase [Candidatus Amesbacteria bacterium]
MSKAKIFKNLLMKPGSIQLPVAHDCLSAKLIENAGFEALSVGGFAIAGVNWGLPDVGLLGLSDMTSVIEKIIKSIDIPVFADGDGGYGNARNVYMTVREYERIGVASMFIEDQKHPKRCGHMDGKELVGVEEMRSKIIAAKNAQTDPDFTICARTDAIAVEGFESSINRSLSYIEAGADIIFIEAPENLEQLIQIPKLVTQIPLLVNMLEGGKTPILSQKDLTQLGYKLIAYPVTTLFTALKATRDSLLSLKSDGVPSMQNMFTFPEYKNLVQLDKYI